MDSKKIIEKLFNIANKQQQIIMKLAQDPNIAYLQQAANTAAANLNTGFPISIHVSLGAAQSDSSPGVVVSPNYIIKVEGLANHEQYKMQFKTNFDKIISIQKPELAAGISIIYS